MTMTRPQKITTAAVVAALVVLYIAYRPQTPTVTIDPRSLPDQRYDPFSHWRHDHPADWFRPWPLTVGPVCLPQIYQAEDHGLALEQGVAPSGSYAQ